MVVLDAVLTEGWVDEPCRCAGEMGVPGLLARWTLLETLYTIVYRSRTKRHPFKKANGMQQVSDF